MPRAVRFNEYGPIEVLQVVDVERPRPSAGEVLVEVRAAAINPGEAMIRKGALADRFPATFPSGQGSDLAGVVVEVGDGVDQFAVGDEVFGWTDQRASHAELVVADVEHLAIKPSAVSWEIAGSLYVVGATAFATVRAVAPTADDTVVVSAAAGGVGSLAVQLARATGATVIGLASPQNHEWLEHHGVVPVTYGDGQADRIRAAATQGRVDAFIDTFGGGYVDLAVELGVDPSRIDTIADWAAAERVGAKTDGNAVGASIEVLQHLADWVAQGTLEVPIARVYALDDVQDAFRELEQRHTHGKIVLRP